ncbi:MAG TPA: YIP1 family protein [Terriglobia bacterium]|jgi:hypothetical protein
MASFADRMIRAARLDASLYEEVERDQGATGQAMLVVILSSLAAGIGVFRGIGVLGLVFATLATLLGWVVWASLTYVIGTKLLPEAQTRANVGELLRTTGFSSAPGVIRILGLVPGLALVSFWGAAIWMLLAMVVAVRQALDFKSTVRAVCVCFISGLVAFCIVWLLGGSPLEGPAR